MPPSHSTGVKAPVGPVPVPEEISAYAGYLWDPKTFRLESRPILGEENNYGDLELGLCRTDPALGGRIKISGATPGYDRFSPAQVRSTKHLFGLSEKSSAIVLDQEAKEPGHLCLQATDPVWLKAKYEQIQKNCESTLGKNSANLCQTLEHSVKEAARIQTFWDRYVDGLPMGLAFVTPAFIAGGLALLKKFIFKGPAVQPVLPPGATPSLILMFIPDCSLNEWSMLGGRCADHREEI